MKTFQTIFLFLILSPHLYSQEKTIASGGIGFPVIIAPNHSPSDVYSSSGFDFFVEKQIVFFTYKPWHFSVNPGLNFIKFQEYYSTTGLGHWYEYDKYSRAVSIYSKLIMDFTIKPDHLLKFFGGAISGVYLWSEAKKIQYRKVQNQDNGKSFFNAAYFGILIGVAPNLPNNFISPKLELSFYPNFVTMNDQNRNAINISLLVSFNSRKKNKD